MVYFMKLNKHLVIKTTPLALNENIVFFNDYRISVLTNELLELKRVVKRNLLIKLALL